MISYKISIKALEYLPKDNECSTYILTDVKNIDKSWEITSEMGSMFVPNINTNFKPKKGMKVTYYGKGFGYIVRGVTLPDENVIFYYRTPEEAEQDHKDYIEVQNNEKKAKYEKHKAKFDKIYNDYPDVFKRRIDRFRANNPDFNWEYLDYELFCCSDAIKIANKLKTVEQIDHFKEMGWKAQRMLVDISPDHSGNTFSCSVELAKIYLINPEDIPKVHGAMCVLVGCSDYGCIKKQRNN